MADVLKQENIISKPFRGQVQCTPSNFTSEALKIFFKHCLTWVVQDFLT